ncbi:MAG: SGNH/GDSL hydrolase family protein [Planctomycetes bacterium]|nr:SGNH/GDSL hydrolase family protein [Planctomycetota bacterium]
MSQPESPPPASPSLPQQPVDAQRLTRRRKVLFAVAAVLIVFALAEAVLRTFNFTFALTDLHARFPGAGLARYSQKHPDWFWELKPLMVMGDDRRGLTYEINRLGFRGVREWLPKKPKDTLRVLCLGDSCTFGLGVKFEDCYTVRLEALLNAPGASQRFEVLNAGSPGYSSYQGWRILEKQLADFEPDVVTFYFGKNEAEAAFAYSDKDQNALRAFRLRAALDKSRVYQLCSWLVALKLRAVARLRGVPYGATDEKTWHEVNRGRRPGLVRVSHDEFVENARNIIALGRRHGFKVFLLTYPYATTLNEEEWRKYHPLPLIPAYNTRLRALAEQENVLLVDLQRVLAQRNDPTLFLKGDPIHPTPKGHDLIAQELLRAVGDGRFTEQQRE